MKTITIIIVAIVLLTGSQSGRCEGSISLSPAGLSLKGPAGQTTTQQFKITNSASAPYRFKVEITDVVIEHGERRFIPAGRSKGSIAIRAFPPLEEIVLGAGEQRIVPVTFVLPNEEGIRAVAVFFRGRPEQSDASAGPRVRLNLGTVVDFSISDEVLLDAAQPDVVAPTATHNLQVVQRLTNVGHEPVIARGMTAILRMDGKLVGKTVFDSKRLLPSEHNFLEAEYNGVLVPGRYRILSSIEYAGKTVNRQTALVVP